MTYDAPELMTVEEAIRRVVAVLKHSGFEFRQSSMKSEAAYYGLPGCTEQIRVASHGKRKDTTGLARTVAKITLPPNYTPKPGHIVMTKAQLHTLVAYGVGRYWLAVGHKLKVNSKC